MYTCDQAERLGLTGWVSNRDDGSVEVVAEGSDSSLVQLLAWCRRGPPYSRVNDVAQEYSDARDEFENFSIKH